MCTSSLLLILAAASAQEVTSAAAVRAFNQQILQLHAALQRGSSSDAAGVKAQADSVLRRRSAALERMIREQPSEALKVAFSSDLLSRLAAAFPESATALEEQGTWTGRVEYLTIDDVSGAGSRDLVTLKHSGGSTELKFATPEPAGLQSGAVLTVRGVRAGNVAVVTSTQLQAATTCSPAGDQKTVVLLANLPGSPLPTLTKAQVSDMFFSPTLRSVSEFWREASYGKTAASGDVFGWYTLDQNYTCDQYYQIRDAAIRAADADVNFLNYNRIFVIFRDSGSCNWSGISNVGCATASSADGTINASSSWMRLSYTTTHDQGVKLATHEGGHGLGLSHARSADYGSQAIGAIGSTASYSEYGDVFNTMGAWNFGHYAAPQKQLLGWTPAANLLTVETSGSYVIQPTEIATAGVQALKVRRGTGNNAWLWLEYRQQIGAYDSTLGSQVFSGALIHYEETATNKTNLIDFTTETSGFTDPALAVGQTWVDPYSNLTVSVISATTAGLTVQVSYGALPCVAASPTLTVSPSNPSLLPGQSGAFSVSVKNNDSLGCSSRTFALDSTTPAGWPSVLSASSLPLSPGQTAAVTLTKAAPGGTALGTYPFAVTASEGTTAGSASAACTVVAPPPTLTATLATGSTTYTARSTVTATVSALSGTQPAAGATVTFTVTRPNGSSTVGTATTDSTGHATWSLKLGPKDGPGNYALSAKVTLGTQSFTTAPILFTVQ